MKRSFEHSRRILQPLLLITAGAVVGVLTSLWVSRSSAPPVEKKGPASISLQPTPATERENLGMHDAQRRRMLDLERRIASMEAAAEAGVHSQAEAKEAPEELEAEQHRNVEMHEQAVARHWEEPIDKAWSSATAKLFEDDFGTLEQKEGLKLVSVDCRTRSCLATVEWKTFDEAQQGFDAILHHLYAANCTREILLPEPNDRARPYQATPVFNCEAWRSAQR